jgi:type VI secretion system protein ImpI
MGIRLEIISQQRNALGPKGVKEFGHAGGTIGRALSNDWPLPDACRFLSARHAAIDYRSGTYYIVDTSTNGVFVNDSERPVGRGNPQRLFHNDQIRLGDYLIKVRLDIGKDTVDDIIKDDHIDPVSLAQRVDMPEATTSDLLDPHIMTGVGLELEQDEVEDNSPTMEVPTIRGKRAPAATAKAQQPPVTGLVAAFFRGAGLEAESLDAKQQATLLMLAGQLLRELSQGLAQTLQNQARQRAAFGLGDAATPSPNNPLRSLDRPPGALRSVLYRQSPEQLGPIEAVRDALRATEAHNGALLDAVPAAVWAYLKRLDPSVLEARFAGSPGQGAAGAIASVASKLKYWELYSDLYKNFCHSETGRLPAQFSEDLSAAFESTLERAASARRRAGNGKGKSNGRG